ncbi:hypothetical protein BT69DRAFT_1306683 [Atractiella rhizophila]|nr:hypothetical protein BT69DRAFT_1306683 [Atractiella rhizophila]
MGEVELVEFGTRGREETEEEDDRCVNGEDDEGRRKEDADDILAVSGGEDISWAHELLEVSNLLLENDRVDYSKFDFTATIHDSFKGKVSHFPLPNSASTATVEWVSFNMSQKIWTPCHTENGASHSLTNSDGNAHLCSVSTCSTINRGNAGFMVSNNGTMPTLTKKEARKANKKLEHIQSKVEAIEADEGIIFALYKQ